MIEWKGREKEKKEKKKKKELVSLPIVVMSLAHSDQQDAAGARERVWEKERRRKRKREKGADYTAIRQEGGEEKKANPNLPVAGAFLHPGGAFTLGRDTGGRKKKEGEKKEGKRKKPSFSPTTLTIPAFACWNGTSPNRQRGRGRK